MTSRRLALVVAGLGVLLIVAAVTLSIGNGSFQEDPVFILFAIAFVLSYVVTGFVIAIHQPHNAIGWLFMGIACAFSLGGVASEYLVRGVFLRDRPLPGMGFATWLNAWATVAATALPLIPLLYPDGRLPSPRWRPALWAAIAFPAVGVLVAMFSPEPVEINLGSQVAQLDNPVGLDAAKSAVEVLGFVIGLGLIASFALGVAALVLRARRRRGDERQQVLWVA
jgi:hypothetical protein